MLTDIFVLFIKLFNGKREVVLGSQVLFNSELHLLLAVLLQLLLAIPDLAIPQLFMKLVVGETFREMIFA